MISRIALFTCFLIGFTCVTSQQATIQSQLSTNQTLSLYFTCNFPYATATDDQGILYSSCAQNNGSQGIIYTYRDTEGNIQAGWVTSPGNGSCSQSWGIAVSRDGNYVFATCNGNPSNRQIMGYEKQMNGSTWYWNFMSLNTSNWACFRDIVYDDMTEDIYAICGPALGSIDTRIIKFAHNETSDSYMIPQDLSIMANYIKYNTNNDNLYYATTTTIGYFPIHIISNETSITIPTNITIIPVNGTLTYWCEITSFTFSHNSSNTSLFVGCTGYHSLATSYSSYSILRIDMNQTWMSVNVTIPVIITNTTDNSTTILNITSTETNLTWNYQVMNISYTDSKLSGPDGNTDLTYPADGSCKAPSDMEVDSMNQLYVACMQNAPTRSVIRYTPMNSTSYLPAYVTTAVGCSHPLTNSLSITPHDDVLVSCSANNMGLLFGTLLQNNTLTPTNAPNNSSSSSTGGATNGTAPTSNPISNPGSSTGPTSNPGSSTGPTSKPGSSTGPTSNPGSSTGPTSNPSTGGSSGTNCVGGICASSTGRGNNTIINTAATQASGGVGGVVLALILLVVSM